MKKIFITISLLISINITIISQADTSKSNFKYISSGYYFAGGTLDMQGLSIKVKIRVYNLNVAGFGGHFRLYKQDDFQMPLVVGPTGISLPIYTRPYVTIRGNINLYYFGEGSYAIFPEKKTGGFGYEVSTSAELPYLFLTIGYRWGPTYPADVEEPEYIPFKGIFLEFGIGLAITFPSSMAKGIKKVR
jgi:hypothetical protein